jgi:hypothetical protein
MARYLYATQTGPNRQGVSIANYRFQRGDRTRNPLVVCGPIAFGRAKIQMQDLRKAGLILDEVPHVVIRIMRGKL